MFKQAIACAFLVTLASCNSSNALETQPTALYTSQSFSSVDFKGVYDLIETNRLYTDCGSSIEITLECSGLKIYNSHTYETDDYCNIDYPKRNPSLPDRNPPPPDRNPPQDNRYYKRNPYTDVTVTINGNTVTGTNDYLTKSITLDDGYLYKVKTHKGQITKCTYQKR